MCSLATEQIGHRKKMSGNLTGKVRDNEFVAAGLMLLNSAGTGCANITLSSKPRDGQLVE